MIENCRTLQECEEVLSKKIKDVNYIGEIELSKNDIAVLETLLCTYLEQIDQESVTLFLRNCIPVATAVYFVYQGVINYVSGNYWSLISENLDIKDPSKQVQWGSWMLDFIKERNLAQVNTERTYHYVTPILVHGGIPQSLLRSFYDKIVIPLVKMKLMEDEKIRDFLHSYRVWEQERRKYKKQIEQFNMMKQNTEKEKQYWQKVKRSIERAIELLKKLENFKTESLLHQNLRETYDRKKLILKCLKQKIKKLIKERNTCIRIIKSYTETDCNILKLEPIVTELEPELLKLKDFSNNIEQLVLMEKKYEERLNPLFNKYWNVIWKEEYGVELENLDIEALENKITLLKKENENYIDLLNEEKALKAKKVPWHSSIKTGTYILATCLLFTIITTVFSRMIFQSQIQTFFQVIHFLIPAAVASFSGLLCIARYSKWRKKNHILIEKVKNEINKKENKLNELKKELETALGSISFTKGTSVTEEILRLGNVKEIYSQYKKVSNSRKILEQQLKEHFKPIEDEIATVFSHPDLGITINCCVLPGTVNGENGTGNEKINTDNEKMNTDTELMSANTSINKIDTGSDRENNMDANNNLKNDISTSTHAPYEECPVSRLENVFFSNPDEFVKGWNLLLSNAKNKYFEAKNAEQKIRQEINPGIASKRMKIKQAFKDMRRIEELVLVLGEGNLEKGFEMFEAFQKDYMELQEIEDFIKKAFNKNFDSIKNVSSAKSLESIKSIENSNLKNIGSNIESGIEIIEENIENEENKSSNGKQIDLTTLKTYHNIANSIYLEKQENLKAIEQKIQQMKTDIKSLSSFVRYAGEYVEYFLLYGGEWAENWLIGLTQLTYQTINKGEIPDEHYINELCYIYQLPKRCIAAFKEWIKSRFENLENIETSTIREEERYEDKKGYGENQENEKNQQYEERIDIDDIANDEELDDDENFQAPELVLNSISGELNIIIPAQTFYINNDDDIFEPAVVKIMEVNNGNNEEKQIEQLAELNLRKYYRKREDYSKKEDRKEDYKEDHKEDHGENEDYSKSKNLVETQEQSYILEELAEKFILTLSIGEKLLHTWELDGMAAEKPFLVFNENGSMIPINRCSNKKVWFLIRDGYELDARIPIIEERETYLIMDPIIYKNNEDHEQQAQAEYSSIEYSSIENNQQHSKYKSDEYNEQLSIHKEYNRCKILLADTTGIYRFSLIKKSGKDVSIVEYTCYIEQNSWEPYLEGGKIIPYVSLSERDVYLENPLKIVIPLTRKSNEEDTVKASVTASKKANVIADEKEDFEKASNLEQENASEEKVSLLNGWNIMIKQGMGKESTRKYYRVEELSGVDINSEKGYAVIPLFSGQLFKDEPVGFYTVCLKNPKGRLIYLDWVTISGFSIDFEPKLHFPSDKFESITAKLVLPQNLQLSVKTPAKIISSCSGTHEIKAPWNAEVITAELTFPLKVDLYNETLRRGNGEKLPIKDSLSIHLNEMMTYKIEIKLPITKWKIQGLKNTSFPAWNAIEQEIWIDDLIEAIQLYLHIFVPIKSARYYRFYLKGTDHFTDGEFKNGYAVIELLEFIDTIKSLSNTSLIEFYMDVYEKVGFNIQLIDGGCLFVIRTRWEVTDISWDTWEVEDKIKLQLKWRNLGGINDRILRLWKCHRPWEIPLSYSIPDGKDNFEIIEEKTQLMPAKYIAQFDIDESWHNIFDESRLELYSESELDTFNASKSDKHDFYGKSNSYLHTNFQFPRENFNICYIDIKENKYITSDNNTSNSITGQSAKVNSIIDACIKKWEINWIGENKAIIDGETSKVLEGQKVTAYLLGIYRGKPAVYKADSSVSSGGNFQIMFDSYSCLTNVYQKGKLKLKNVVHWIIIRIDSTVPIYTVSILPEPSPISINLKLNKKNLQSKSHLYNQLFDAKGDKRYLDRIHEKQEINEIITPLMKYLQYIEIVSIDEKNKKNKEKGSLREYRFYNHNQCKKIINAYTVGVKELELLGDNRSNQQRIRLVLDSSTGEYFLGIFKEVKCLGCGAIVPSQEIWHREHYPNPKCKTKDGGKGLNPLYVGKLKISTFLTLDYSTIFSKIKSFYPQAAKFVMELYSSSYTDFNLPSYVWQNKDVWLDKDANKNKNNREKGYTFDWHKLVSALVNKEIELIKLIEKELQNIS